MAGVDAMAEQMDRLHLGLRRGSARDQLVGFIFNSGLSEAERMLMWRLIDEIVGEKVESGVMGERERLKKVEDAVLDSGGEVALVAARLIEVEAEWDAAREGEGTGR